MYDGVCNSPVARTFFWAQRVHCVLRTSSCVSHTRMAQAQVVSKRCLLHMYHNSASCLLYLIFHPSLQFLNIHFDITLSFHNLAVLSRPKSAGHAPLRTCIEKFGYLAKSDANIGYEPKKFDKITSVDSDTMLIDDLDLNEISDFSTHTTTLDCSVFSQCLNHLFPTFLMMILLFK